MAIEIIEKTTEVAIYPDSGQIRVDKINILYNDGVELNRFDPSSNGYMPSAERKVALLAALADVPEIQTQIDDLWSTQYMESKTPPPI